MVNTTTTSPAPVRSSGYSYYVIAVLMLAYMLSLTDRVILGFLIEPVRAELGLTDTQIGLLLGFGFVLFYSILGIPLGALADRGNRRNIITVGIIVWSLATAASGLAAGFIGLLVARALVGAGEATLTPCTISTIGDRFEPEKSGFAYSLYSLGGIFGIGIAMALGGYLVHWTRDMSMTLPFIETTIEGWRLVFMLVGLAGVPFALFLFFTVSEAPRRKVAMVKHPSMIDIMKHIRKHGRAFFGLFGGYSAQVFSTYVPILWAAAHFQRYHNLDPQYMGWTFGIIFGLCGGIGVIIGGLLSDKLTKRGILEAPATVLMWSVPFQIPLVWIAFTTTDSTTALIVLGISMAVSSLYGGLQGTIVQVMTPGPMQGRMMAIYLLCITILGMGLGPSVVGFLSDYVYEGPMSLGYALATSMVGALVVTGIILWFSLPHMRRCIAAVRAK